MREQGEQRDAPTLLKDGQVEDERAIALLACHYRIVADRSVGLADVVNYERRATRRQRLLTFEETTTALRS